MTTLKPYFEHYGYWAIVAAVLPAGFGIPTPGETTLIVATILAVKGELSLSLVIVTALCSTIAGNTVGYCLGYYGGRPIILRWGRYLGVTEGRLSGTELFFVKHGGKVLLFARFFDVFRQLNGIVAGVARMGPVRFQVYNTFGGFLWVGCWAGAVYALGHRMRELHRVFVKVESVLVIALVIASIALALRLFRRHTSRQQPP
ncbi:MAG TPA: DedA family protein [Syntrophorhabdaceae bacterium]|nr:DedA family protein [Syntrophorhabdaceae bacterium]